MRNPITADSRLRRAAQQLFLQFGALNALPASRVMPSLEPLPELAARRGQPHLEIVSHCWRYSHLLAYQLSSLVKYDSAHTHLTFTLFYSPEDRATVALIERFRTLRRPRLEWNFQPLRREFLLRRAIGRNYAAHSTAADWIWFTDCDVVFHEGCLDSLSRSLQGCREPLVYPRRDRCTALLAPADPMLQPNEGQRLIDIDPSRFVAREFTRAQGAYQITHGDVARARGYCRQLPMYQQPAEHWRKTYEDRAFRWLLGTDGTAIDVTGLYRIRHVAKGRYGEGMTARARLRGGLRWTRSWLHDNWKRQTGGA